MSAAQPTQGRRHERNHSISNAAKNTGPGVERQACDQQALLIERRQGAPIEEWQDIVRRVVGHVSAAEKDARKRDEFFAAMSDVMLAREFVPNTPCLVNAGRANGQLAACFVLEVPDSITGIMDHAKAAATIHQTGGGTGMTYEFLRPSGVRWSVRLAAWPPGPSRS